MKIEITDNTADALSKFFDRCYTGLLQPITKSYEEEKLIIEALHAVIKEINLQQEIKR